jgi:hypothetical protein
MGGRRLLVSVAEAGRGVVDALLRYYYEKEWGAPTPGRAAHERTLADGRADEGVLTNLAETR